MTMMMTTRMTTTIRASVALIALFAAASLALAQKGSHAVIAGSVFRENGFSLPGATVTLAPKDAAKGGKGKILKSVTDTRGEFAFRVPATVGHYVITAAMKGFRPAETDAAVAGEERVDVTLILPAESK